MARENLPRARGGVHCMTCWSRVVAVAGLVILLMGALRLASAQLALSERPAPPRDVYAGAQVRDVRYALELYARENGRYPARLADLVEDRWVGRDQVTLTGYQVLYRLEPGGRAYRLDIKRDR
jgi:hypothetical protein